MRIFFLKGQSLRVVFFTAKPGLGGFHIQKQFYALIPSNTYVQMSLTTSKPWVTLSLIGYTTLDIKIFFKAFACCERIGSWIRKWIWISFKINGKSPCELTSHASYFSCSYVLRNSNFQGWVYLSRQATDAE